MPLPSLLLVKYNIGVYPFFPEKEAEGLRVRVTGPWANDDVIRYISLPAFFDSAFFGLGFILGRTQTVPYWS